MARYGVDLDLLAGAVLGSVRYVNVPFRLVGIKLTVWGDVCLATVR